MTPPIQMRALRLEDEEQARSAQRELEADHFSFLLNWWPGSEWGSYLERLEHERLGVALAEGRVAATFLVAECVGELVGRVSIRHELNEYLEQYGGHIGYCVRPGWRRQGMAREMLRQSLLLAPGLVGGDSVLVTCDRGNEGSRRVIESCGGVFDGERFDPRGSVWKQRFWIAL